MNRRDFIKSTIVGSAALALPAVSAREKKYSHQTSALPVQFASDGAEANSLAMAIDSYYADHPYPDIPEGAGKTMEISKTLALRIADLLRQVP